MKTGFYELLCIECSHQGEQKHLILRQAKSICNPGQAPWLVIILFLRQALQEKCVACPQERENDAQSEQRVLVPDE